MRISNASKNAEKLDYSKATSGGGRGIREKMVMETCNKNKVKKITVRHLLKICAFFNLGLLKSMARGFIYYIC